MKTTAHCWIQVLVPAQSWRVIMSGRFGVALALGTALVVLCAAASAQEHWNSAERDHIFATLPNWSGLWESKWEADADDLTGYPAAESGPLAEFVAKYFPLAGKAPYEPGWKRERRTATKITASKACGATRFPALLEWPLVFQVYVTPEETLFLYESGEVRHIHTDGREHPKKEDLWPTDTGNSVGHWEGQTLVIDTIEIEPGPTSPIPGSVDLSDRAHFTERVRRVDPGTMQDDLTIDDPARFANPWHVSTRWSRVLDQDRMLPWDCENDRNPIVNGKITVAPPR